MHKQNLIVSVQSNKTNKFYRESAGKVFVPFSDEYSIYIKNLDTRRVVLDFTIDGIRPREYQIVLNGKEWFVLESDDTNHAFKFIEKTAKISKHRGDKAEDGLITVTYQFEKPYIPHPFNGLYYAPSIRYFGGPYVDTTGQPPTSPYSWGVVNDIKMSSTDTQNHVLTSSAGIMRGIPMNSAGITVQGSEIKQEFEFTSVGTLEDGATITLELVGETPTGRPVTQKHTSRSKIDCPTCGRINSAASNYCIECGTAVW